MFHPSDDYRHAARMEEHTVEQVTPFAALIGIDWSDRKHDVCLIDAASGHRELTIIAHTPETLNEWACAVRARFGGEKAPCA